MPVAQTDLKQAGHRQHIRVARNDSLKSERSDKRVSFNNDVGVKHIPRGQKENAPRPPKVPLKDEWSNCTPVNLEKPVLSSQELEQQAEDLVRLLDQVDCVSATKPIHNSFNSRSLDRKKNKNKFNTNKNNSKTLNNNEKNNNIVNGVSENYLSNNRTTNPIGKNKKENINLFRHRHSNNLKEGKPPQHSVSSPYEKFSPGYKSVPDIPSTIYYNNTSDSPTKYNNLKDSDSENNKNFMSVDNLYEIRGKNYITPSSYKNKKNRNEYKSADNLTDISIPGTRKLQEYKPYENLQSGFSSTTDIKMDNDYHPKVGNMIKRFNSDSGEPKVRTHQIYLEDSPPRGYKESNRYYNHNNSKPFSYTSAPLSSVEEIRRLSPSREIPIVKDSSYYAQVNKHDRRARSNSREYDHHSKTTDSDYSAKIIITGNNVHSRYDDDDHAYETYQVGGSPFAKHLKKYDMSSEDIFDSYKNHSNNNINMSSIGVQTERLPKAPQRSRRNQNIVSSTHHESYNDHEYRQDLPSASLVRRINHGFGRIDRSPSPPPLKMAPSHRMTRNVVPLLSDTDDSEFDYHRRMDPLAKIRNQVMIREKLQEEKESEEREEREAELFERRHKSLVDLNSTGMQPLTVDEVDALTLEVDKKGRNTLIVAHERSSKDVTDKIQTAPSRGRKSDPDSKGGKERSLSPRIFSTLERLKKSNNDKDKSTLERNKGKEKKKKKIKIKFFYDPRPQDTPNEDPLNKYTEYKGSNSDDQEPSKSKKESSQGEEEYYDDYYNEKRNKTTVSKEYHSLSREGNKEKERRYRYDSSESPSREDSSPTRPPRNSPRERSTDNIMDRNRNKVRYNRDLSNERILRKDNRDLPNNKIRPGSRSDYESTIDKRDKKTNNNKNNYLNENKEYERNIQYNNNNIRNESRFIKSRTEEYNYKNERENENKNYSKNRNDYDDTDHHDSSDQGPSLSEKYKSLTKRTSPSIEKTPPKTNERNPSRNNVEDEERKQKMERQRKKFFGVLLGEGKAKGTTTHSTETKTIAPPPPSETKMISSTLPRTNQPHREPPHSNTLQRFPKEDVDEGSTKPNEKGLEGRAHISRDREADYREKQQWESATLSRTNLNTREKGKESTPSRGVKEQRNLKDSKYSAESSPSSIATPTGRPARSTNYKQRYFGDTDNESSRRIISPSSGGNDYRSLPNRKSRTNGTRQNLMTRRGIGMRKTSPGARGSAGSSLQSSESEADSQGGSHASRASHVSTGSNRSVYLHATAVADIPVRRSSDEAPSERGISKQSKKVTRSFSLISPWKPRHYREKYEVEYDNREIREPRDVKENGEERNGRKSALPPRPPRKIQQEGSESSKKVGRSQTVYKDSKLAGWLRRKRNKEVKGI